MQEIRNREQHMIGLDSTEDAVTSIVTAMVVRRHEMNISQRELAEMCGIPHSSVARIESGKIMPKLSTVLKIYDQLGLKLVAQSVN